jgi:hypothetical protein
MKNTTNDLTAFKNRIFAHGILVSLIFEAGSLLFLGIDAGFAYGLALGTFISVVNFNILAFTSQKILRDGRAWTSFVSYIIRLAVYGFAFYMASRVSGVAALGAALGFISLKIAIYFIHIFKAPRAAAPVKREPRPAPPERRRRKGIMKDVFSSPYDDEDEEEEDATEEED